MTAPVSFIGLSSITPPVRGAAPPRALFSPLRAPSALAASSLLSSPLLLSMLPLLLLIPQRPQQACPAPLPSSEPPPALCAPDETSGGERRARGRLPYCPPLLPSPTALPDLIGGVSSTDPLSGRVGSAPAGGGMAVSRFVAACSGSVPPPLLSLLLSSAPLSPLLCPSRAITQTVASSLCAAAYSL